MALNSPSGGFFGGRRIAEMKIVSIRRLFIRILLFSLPHLLEIITEILKFFNDLKNISKTFDKINEPV